jgi:hypothetical protein
MAMYEFALVVDGFDPDDDAQTDRLFTAAPDIAGVEGTTLHFARDGATFSETVLATIDEVEGLGIEVLRVEPDDPLLYASEIADRLDRSRQSIDMLVRGERGPGSFPAPASHAGERSPLWLWSDVRLWFAAYDRARYGHLLDELEQVREASAMNDALRVRRLGLTGLVSAEDRRTAEGLAAFDAIVDRLLIPVRERTDRRVKALVAGETLKSDATMMVGEPVTEASKAQRARVAKRRPATTTHPRPRRG